MLLIPVHVRLASANRAADVAALEGLWGASQPQLRGVVRDVAERLRVVMKNPAVVIFVASSEQRDVGFIILTTGPLLPLLTESTVTVEHLFVLPAARRLGVARTLIGRAAAYAGHHGVRRLATNVPAGDRAGHRFFARLGFSPVVVRRVVSVVALRRRLLPELRPVHEVTVLRRRSTRVRIPSGTPEE
jgi:GNAT superfamily N-acetyltransferase